MRCVTVHSGPVRWPSCSAAVATYLLLLLKHRLLSLFCQVRTLVQQEMFAALEKYDCLISPAAPTAAYPIGGKVSDPLSMYKEDLMTVSLNLSGLPAVVLPCGYSKEGGEAEEVTLPVGLQMIGKMFGEGELLAAAHVFETAVAAAGSTGAAHKPQVMAQQQLVAR